MKKWLLILSILFTGIANAQNYQCLQFGPKNYFTNGNGYLRGIRIDSVSVVGSDTIYHAFHTPRAMGYTISANIPAYVDSDGGSWLGKNIIQHTDGTFLFDNIWGDTVIIKTQAAPGDSWRFFDDATNIHYTATLTSLDTMTVLGNLDSIKTITITADTAGTPRTTDPVNNFQLKLSKNYGFVQAFDLYTFPYHMPDSLSDISSTEYYLDLVIGRIYDPGYDLIPGPWHGRPEPDTSNSIFRLVSLQNQTQASIYDFVTGDVYEHHKYETHMLGGGGIYIYTDFLDTVTSRASSSGILSYTTAVHYNDITYPAGTNSPYNGILYNSYGGTPIIDTTLMPEERGNNFYYEYLPNEGPDTSFCTIKGRYVVHRDHISSLGGVYYETNADIGWSLPTHSWTYYAGYGLWSHKWHDVQYEIEIDDNITYFYKNGVVCYGAFRWLTGINDINAPITEVQLVPNPANELLTVRTNLTGGYTISITNMLGQTALSMRALNAEENVAISQLRAGLYNVIIADGQGNRVNRKLVIAH